MIMTRAVDIKSQAVSPEFILRSFLPTGVFALDVRGRPTASGLSGRLGSARVAGDAVAGPRRCRFGGERPVRAANGCAGVAERPDPTSIRPDWGTDGRPSRADRPASLST